MTSLELTVDEGRPPSASRFFQAGSDLVELLNELADVPVEWIIGGLRLGSAVVAVTAPPDHPEASVALEGAVAGLRQVAAGNAPPTEWHPDAVTTARRLSEATTPDADGGRAHLRLVGASEGAVEVDLDQDLASRLADIQPFTRTMPGSVRGHMVGMNISRGNRASIRLPSGRVVRVRFADDMRQQLKEALLQEVELVGDIRQDSDGRIFHIRATSARVLTKPRIGWSDLFGIDPDITGGLSVEEYLERSRGEA